jgi:Tfp pilus assembly protein PilZ
MSGVRRWPRLDLALNVRIRCADVEDLMNAETVNVSRGGIFIRMERPREVGTQVVVDATVGDRPVIRLGGVVVRTVPDPDDPSPQEHLPRGMGVHLTEVPDEWIEVCDEIARRRETDQGGDEDR